MGDGLNGINWIPMLLLLVVSALAANALFQVAAGTDVRDVDVGTLTGVSIPALYFGYQSLKQHPESQKKRKGN